MGILGREILNGLFDMGPFGTGPDIIDKVDMLFTDAKEEGKKRGYSRAAEEYGKVFRSIESEYKQAKELIESQKNMYDIQSDALIEKLEELEKQKRRLENEVEQKTKAVFEKYDISVSQVKRGLNSAVDLTAPESVEKGHNPAAVLDPAAVLVGLIVSESRILRERDSSGSILDMVYDYKVKKLLSAELDGYLKAKKVYEEKIGKLKKELEELKRKGSAEIQEMSNMIIEILDAIADEQMKIAELKILL